jgi:ribose transport system ATP-binding protein
MSAIAIEPSAMQGHAGPAEPVLRTFGLTRRYGQNVALADASLAFLGGEVHVLFGENGAGKSTLIGMIAGANQPTSGEIAIDGFRGCFQSVGEARRHGVRAVFQEFSLVPLLTVAENITLGEEPTGSLGLLSREQTREEARRLIRELGFDLDVDERVESLPRGRQQMVEICKALRRRPRLLILDEPTASLSEHDAQALFKLVRRLKEAGTAVIYITHRMHEIPVIGDRVSVLRDGRLVATVAAGTPENRLIELMTGRTLAKIYPAPTATLGPVRLSLRAVTLAAVEGACDLAGVDLEVRAGEIVGVAGLVGCGKSELGQACFGLRRVGTGEIRLDGKAVRFKHPADAIAAGLWYSPADRKSDGLALGRPARENMGLSGLRWGTAASRWLRPLREARELEDVSRRVEFPAPRLREDVANFSGGNQQKVLLAKCLVQEIGVYVFDEPTVGVDIGARLSIYQCLAEISAAGAAILLISSDLPELMGMTHRLVVMNSGRITGEFQRAEYDEQRILERFF